MYGGVRGYGTVVLCDAGWLSIFSRGDKIKTLIMLFIHFLEMIMNDHGFYLTYNLLYS